MAPKVDFSDHIWSCQFILCVQHCCSTWPLTSWPQNPISSSCASSTVVLHDLWPLDLKIQSVHLVPPALLFYTISEYDNKPAFNFVDDFVRFTHVPCLSLLSFLAVTQDISLSQSLTVCSQPSTADSTHFTLPSVNVLWRTTGPEVVPSVNVLWRTSGPEVGLWHFGSQHLIHSSLLYFTLSQ